MNKFRADCEKRSDKELAEFRADRIALMEEFVANDEPNDDDRAAFDTAESELRIIEELRVERAAEHDKKVAYAERLAAIKKETRSSLDDNVPRTPSLRVGDYSGDNHQREIRVPASARKIKLKAFDNERDAYMAGQWAMAKLFRNDPARRWIKDHGIEDRVMVGNVNASGGSLIPIEFEAAIIKLVEEYGVFRREAQTSIMMSDTKIQPVWSSGLTTYFLTDATAITPSDESFTSVSLVAKSVGTLTRYSAELSADAAVSIAEELARDIGRAFANTEDSCGFLGNGSATYGGMVGLISALNAGSVYTAITGNTAFSTLDLEDFENMIGQLPAYPGIQPKWFLHKSAYSASMLNLMNAAGGNTIDTLGRGAGLSFMGYPVVFSDVLNSTLTAQTSTAGLVYFGDLSMAALFGDRQGVSIATSEHRYFDSNEIAIRGIERFDIGIHSVGTATTGDAGAIVRLDTPSS